MELINDDEDDLNNKTIKINDEPNTNLSSFGNKPKNEPNAVTKFMKGFKTFLKPKITSADIEKDNIDSNIQSTESSNRNTMSSFSEKKEEKCKDKIANKIIDSMEVERNIGVFVALVSIGSVILCISLFLIPFILTSPKKFSFCFAVGSVFILASFLFLVGTRKFVTKLFENKRLLIYICFILLYLLELDFNLEIIILR